jgi:hypothetical protein
MPTITLSDEFGDAIRDAFKLAEKDGYREVILRIPIPREKQGTMIDRLRTRGTPIELIASYLIAHEEEQALSAFHSSVLEYVYEKLAEDLNAKVGFITRGSLEFTPDTEDAYCVQIIEPRTTNIGIALEPAHDNVIRKEGTLAAPVGTIVSEKFTGHICDDYNASVITLIDAVTTSIVKQITTQVVKARRIVSEGALKIFIVPEMSTSTLTINQVKGSPIRLGGGTKIVACAFIVGEVAK